MANQYTSPDLLTRFLEKVSPEPTSGCWLWTGSISKPLKRDPNGNGYGAIIIDFKVRRAHRVAYELFIGPIPEGLHLDHLCRVRSCVNPRHLEPVTKAENVRRGNGGWNFRIRTSCPQGHPYTPENTHLKPIARKPGRFNRICRQCCVIYNRKRKAHLLKLLTEAPAGDLAAAAHPSQPA